MTRTPLPLCTLCHVLVAATATAAWAVDVSDTRLLSQPAVSAEHVVFAYAGDLWIAGRDGGGARRLTSHPGNETSPRFSPTVRWSRSAASTTATSTCSSCRPRAASRSG